MDLNNDTRIETFEFGSAITRTLPITQESVVTVIGGADKDSLKQLAETADVVECTEVPPLPYFEDQDNAEYVYGVEETVGLVGRKYGEVRRKYNIINKQIDKWQIANSNAQNTNTGLQGELWEFFEKQKRAEDVNAQVEVMAFEKWLMFTEQLPTDLVVVSDGATPFGFGVVEVVGRTLLIHFFKTDHSVTGLAEYLFVEIARMYQGKAEWINFQQDLGIAGLRQFKNHLQPAIKLLTFVIN